MTGSAELLARYKHMRQRSMVLHDRLANAIPKSILDEGGNNLGILHQNKFVLDREDDIAFLMDHCLYDVRRQGRNAVEQMLADAPPPDSEEWMVLDAMRQAAYRLLVVETLSPGVGLQVRDLLRDEAFFLVDIGLSQSASVGLLIATRTFAPDGIPMTTGAALPIGAPAAEARDALVRSLTALFSGGDIRDATPAELTKFSASMIRTCLQGGVNRRISHAKVAAPLTRRSSGALSDHVPAREKLCRCDSGKKYKNCCGKRR